MKEYVSVYWLLYTRYHYEKPCAFTT